MVAKTAPNREQFWLQAWYQGRWWLWLLWPLSLIFRSLANWRRYRQAKTAERLPAPVIVVGNITLGGTGKTPLIIALARYLQREGWRPGVLSRGYGARAPSYPYHVAVNSSPQHSGDEPLQIAREGGCPVVVDRDRVAAARSLIEQHGCNILLSDDGLQHYRLARQLELALIDGQRGLGNGLCLPAGPLREPPGRLRQVDCVIVNGTDSGNLPGLHEPHCTVSLKPVYWCNLQTGQKVAVEHRPWPFEFEGIPLDAVTGIGNPARFFTSLRDLGLDIRENPFPDHYAFTETDLAFAAGQPLLMTAKDAVKCQTFAQSGWWYLAVEMQLPPLLEEVLQQFLSRLPKGANENKV